MKRTKCPVCGARRIHFLLFFKGVCAEHRRWHEEWRKNFKMQLYTDRMKIPEHTPDELKAWAEIKRVINGKIN